MGIAEFILSAVEGLHPSYGISESLSLSHSSFSSMHVHAAVYADGLARHEIAVVGGEKDHGAD